MSAPTTNDKTVIKRLGSAVTDVLRSSQKRADDSSAETAADEPESEPEGPKRGGKDSNSTADDDGEAELPLDQVFEILKNSRRRQTLHYLEDNGGEASLSDLAEHIAAIENDTSVAAISSSQRKRVYVGLYQCHLPKMDDMGIIDFDQNRGTISRASAANQLVPYLEESTQPPWHRMYGGISAAGAVLFLLSVFGNAPLGLTPTVVLAALLVAVGLCSGAHVRYLSTES